MSERPLRLLVTGSRYLVDRGAVTDALLDWCHANGWPVDATLVHGECPTGADRIADYIWRSILHQPAEPHAADWGKYGPAAGPIRNMEMVDSGVDHCIAFFVKGIESKGTRQCLDYAIKKGVPTTVIEVEQ